MHATLAVIELRVTLMSLHHSYIVCEGLHAAGEPCRIRLQPLLVITGVGRPTVVYTDILVSGVTVPLADQTVCSALDQALTETNKPTLVVSFTIAM